MTLASKHVTHYGSRSGIPYCKLKTPIEMGFHMRRPWGRSDTNCLDMYFYVQLLFKLQNHVIEKNKLLKLSYGMPICYRDRYAN
jgi:hypothetical protein